MSSGFRSGILTLALLACSGTALAQFADVRCEHFFYGYPLGTPDTNVMVIRDDYALSNNGETKFADWVAYKLSPETVAGNSKEDRVWRADPLLDGGETLEPSDYTGAHTELDVDRGHQAPLASFKNSHSSYQTNYLSNITPQQTDLNQGPWMRLEDDIRDLVKTWQDVWVLTGPLYETDMLPLPQADEPHTVPSGYWKIVATGSRDAPGTFRCAAFIFEQTTLRDDDVADHLTRINEIEQRTGFDFFTELEDYLENQHENNVGVWPLP